MWPLLKQSTSVVVNFGPVTDKTDGVTLESGLVTALDHATTGILLSKNGGAKAVRNGTPTASVYDSGDYRVTLNTTDTNTLGHLRMSYYDAATLVPIWVDFMVVPAVVYDSLVAGSDNLNVSVTEVAGDADAVTRLERVLSGNVTGTVGAASTTTSIVTSAMSPAAAVTDQFKGRIVTFDAATTTANLRGQSTDITASTAGGVLTVTALSTAPVSGDTFTVS